MLSKLELEWGWLPGKLSQLQLVMDDLRLDQVGRDMNRAESLKQRSESRIDGDSVIDRTSRPEHRSGFANGDAERAEPQGACGGAMSSEPDSQGGQNAECSVHNRLLAADR